MSGKGIIRARHSVRRVGRGQGVIVCEYQSRLASNRVPRGYVDARRAPTLTVHRPQQLRQQPSEQLHGLGRVKCLGAEDDVETTGRLRQQPLLQRVACPIAGDEPRPRKHRRARRTRRTRRTRCCCCVVTHRRGRCNAGGGKCGSRSGGGRRRSSGHRSGVGRGRGTGRRRGRGCYWCSSGTAIGRGSGRGRGGGRATTAIAVALRCLLAIGAIGAIGGIESHVESGGRPQYLPATATAAATRPLTGLPVQWVPVGPSGYRTGCRRSGESV